MNEKDVIKINKPSPTGAYVTCKESCFKEYDQASATLPEEGAIATRQPNNWQRES